ncbi:DUF4229 domain-containing protein [Actinocrinis sp.]|uniref:DUF4229 domain-containing protein n=1 Tax=Actinocrinis sp. TaxID=1920516 RepID=UPI002D3042AE|nr:DUF4229 domain-containing protein [Actinocrinis sp.]HZP54188.1 DUF4229 domain-containing protein [Actinocrinis sp.]
MSEQVGAKQKTKAKATNSAKGSATTKEATRSATVAPQPPVTDAERASAPALETRHAVLRYTTLRLALFLVALVLVWAVALIFNMDLSSQLSKLTLLAVALLLSSAASFIVLSKQRDAMSAGIVARTQRLSRKFDDAASFEDDEE